MKVLLLFYWGYVDAGKAGRRVNWLRVNTFMPDAASNFGTDGGNIVNLSIASIYGGGVDWRNVGKSLT